MLSAVYVVVMCLSVRLSVCVCLVTDSPSEIAELLVGFSIIFLIIFHTSCYN